ncbi:MAG: hypothetical protein IJT56_11585 [Clostridia bacterium]|nr:hypothetical protein [Clostridia bacterium]
MYTDKKRHILPKIIAVILIIILAVSLMIAASPSKELDAESISAIRDAVRRTALQCYAVEGVYPPDLEYLEENYGLKINTRDYIIVYEAFASNLPPSIRVVPSL